jgi:hypothetical protein
MNSAVCEVAQADAGVDDTDKATADAPRVSVLAAARSRYLGGKVACSRFVFLSVDSARFVRSGL